MSRNLRVWYGFRIDSVNISNPNYLSLTRRLEFRSEQYFTHGEEFETPTGNRYRVYRTKEAAHRAIRDYFEANGLRLNERVPGQPYDPNWRKKQAAAIRRSKLNGKV